MKTNIAKRVGAASGITTQTIRNGGQTSLEGCVLLRVNLCWTAVTERYVSTLTESLHLTASLRVPLTMIAVKVGPVYE